MLWIALALLTLGVLLIAGLRNERRIRRDWHDLTSPRRDAAHAQVEERFEVELAMADATYSQALKVRELGSTDEAKRLLRLGYQALETFVPNVLHLLALMSVYARMVIAITPQPPLRPNHFRL